MNTKYVKSFILFSLATFFLGCGVYHCPWIVGQVIFFIGSVFTVLGMVVTLNKIEE